MNNMLKIIPLDSQGCPTKKIEYTHYVDYEAKKEYQHSLLVSFDQCIYCKKDHCIVVNLQNLSNIRGWPSKFCIHCIQDIMSKVEFTSEEKKEHVTKTQTRYQNEINQIDNQVNHLKRKRTYYEDIIKQIELD